MLVLTRKQLQTICIGDDIRITVAEVSGGRVKLAIDAPRHITVDREEVHERATDGRLRAAGGRSNHGRKVRQAAAADPGRLRTMRSRKDAIGRLDLAGRRGAVARSCPDPV